MSGVRGRSGRKSKFDEDMLMDTCNLSVRTVHQFLSDTTIPLKSRVQIAKDFAVKKIPNRVEGQGLGDMKIVIVQPGAKKEENADSRRAESRAEAFSG